MKKNVTSILILALLFLMMSMTGCEKAPVVTTPLLRVGILSDTHINADTRHNMYDRLEKALMFYKQKGVDGILITGDLQDRFDLESGIGAMEELQDIWLRVFPDNINDLTGEYVEPMFIYGNHDEALVEEQYWFDGIGSDYEDAWIKEIKGYRFVGVHYTKESNNLTQKLLQQAKEASGDKPWFFAQHVPMKSTVIGGMSSYDGHRFPIQSSVKKSANCVVFTGHTHIPITDERCIWQSNSKKDAQCTVVSCGTQHYSYLQDFSELEINGDAHQTQHGMYMIVDGSQVTLERYSFTDMELTYSDGVGKINVADAKMIGAPWVFDATQKENRIYDYEERAEEAQQPKFPEGAVLEITELTETTVTVKIPAATVEAPEGFSDLVQSYCVELIDTVTGEVVKTDEIAAPYHVDTDPSRLNQSVAVKLTGLDSEKAYTVMAYARECYQKASEPLTIEIAK